jgi:hypothetical protein
LACVATSLNPPIAVSAWGWFPLPDICNTHILAACARQVRNVSGNHQVLMSTLLVAAPANGQSPLPLTCNQQRPAVVVATRWSDSNSVSDFERWGVLLEGDVAITESALLGAPPPPGRPVLHSLMTDNCKVARSGYCRAFNKQRCVKQRVMLLP